MAGKNEAEFIRRGLISVFANKQSIIRGQARNKTERLQNHLSLKRFVFKLIPIQSNVNVLRFLKQMQLKRCTTLSIKAGDMYNGVV